MTEKEALTRIKTGYFGNDYGFDWQILVDTVGTIGEMFRKGQIDEIVRCKECKHRPNTTASIINGQVCFWCEKTQAYRPDGWYCADGERR